MIIDWVKVYLIVYSSDTCNSWSCETRDIVKSMPPPRKQSIGSITSIFSSISNADTIGRLIEKPRLVTSITKSIILVI